MSNATFQVGANEGTTERISFSIDSAKGDALGAVSAGTTTAAVAASETATTNSELTFTAVTAGADGNDISISLVEATGSAEVAAVAETNTVTFEDMSGIGGTLNNTITLNGLTATVTTEGDAGNVFTAEDIADAFAAHVDGGSTVVNATGGDTLGRLTITGTQDAAWVEGAHTVGSDNITYESSTAGAGTANMAVTSTVAGEIPTVVDNGDGADLQAAVAGTSAGSVVSGDTVT